MRSLKELFINPLTAALGAGSGALFLLDPNVLFALGGFLWVNVNSLFTASSTLAFLVAPNVDLGPLEPVVPWAQGVTILLALVFAGKKLDEAYDQLQERL